MTETGSRAARFERERRRRKLIILALLLLLLAGLGYTAYYFRANKRLPSLMGPSPGEIVQPPAYLFSITGEGAERLEQPLGVAYSGGRVYAVDFDARVVRVFDREGRHLFKFNEIEGGTLRNPVHMAIDRQGQVWVTDRRLRGIYVFDRDGGFVRKFVPDGDADRAWTPLAVGFDDAGRILVTDVGESEQHQVEVFEPDGKRIVVFGRTKQVLSDQDDPGAFFFPNGVAGVGGEVFVSDGDNRRVQVFDLKGKFLRFVATSGVPRGIAVDAEGRLYVADALAHQVDIYSLKGERIVRFGEQGFGPGQFRFPNDIALDDTGRIYITDRQNDQIQVWGWPVAEIPQIVRPRTAWQWALCLSPLLLLLWPLLRRRVRFVLTPDFVEAMDARGLVPEMDAPRLVWLAPEDEHGSYVGRVVDGVDLGDLIRPEAHSASDAANLRERLEIDERTAALLALARRAKRLCTTDVEVRKLAALIGVDVYDAEAFERRFARRKA